jgi:hypothetical protein
MRLSALLISLLGALLWADGLCDAHLVAGGRSTLHGGRQVRPSQSTLDDSGAGDVAMQHAGGGSSQVICHRLGSGRFIMVTVAYPAVQSHRAHGDGAPGDPVPGSPGMAFDQNCIPVPVTPLIFDNGVPDLNTALGSETFGQHVAESFVLTSTTTTIAGVTWWGTYGNAATPPLTDNFTLRLFRDLGGVPEPTPFIEIALGDVGRSATGTSLSGFPQFEVIKYSAIISPTTVEPNVTYWISLVNDTTSDPDDDWYWATSSTLGLHAYRQGEGIPWSPSAFDLAFQLLGPDTQ